MSGCCQPNSFLACGLKPQPRFVSGSAINDTADADIDLKKSGVGLQVLYSERWTSNSYQTYNSVTCHNALNTMLNKGQSQIEDTMIKRTSNIVERSGFNGCQGQQSISGSYQPSTNMVSGNVQLSKSCRNRWLQKYHRFPTKVQTRIAGDCGYSGYKCHVEKICGLFDCKRKSYGQVTVKCPVLLQFFG